MESNWRTNVALAGLNNWGINSNEHNERITLCAELITPIHMGTLTYRWVAQVFAANQWLYYLTTGCVPGSTLDFLFSGFGARPFHPPYAVVAD